MLEIQKNKASKKNSVEAVKSRKSGSFNTGYVTTLKFLKPQKHNKLLSCRYELKYRIPEYKARALAKYVQTYLPIDRYSRHRNDYEYPISSLYFDSEKLDLCRETLDRKTNRFKLRIRCYDDEPNSHCFFEIKRRINNVILKDRARLDKNMIAKVILNDHTPDSLYKEHKSIIRQFQFYSRTLHARPLVLVRYMRQAFEGSSTNRVRITFDRKLSFKTVDSPIVSIGGPDWQMVPMDFVILEIKFTDRYPLWLSEMVKVFDLKQTAMSKYVSSVQQSCSMGFCGPACKVGVI